MKSGFITSNVAVKRAYRSINYKVIFFKLVALRNRGTKREQSFPGCKDSHRLLYITFPYSSLCCHFPVTGQFSLINSLISHSFLVEGAFRVFTAAVFIPFFKRLNLTSVTARAHVGVFVGPLKSCIIMWSVDLIRQVQYCTLPKGRVLPCRVTALIHDHATAVDYLIFIVMWSERCNLSPWMAQWNIYTCWVNMICNIPKFTTEPKLDIRVFVFPHCSWRLL